MPIVTCKYLLLNTMENIAQSTRACKKSCLRGDNRQTRSAIPRIVRTQKTIKRRKRISTTNIKTNSQSIVSMLAFLPIIIIFVVSWMCILSMIIYMLYISLVNT